MAILRSRAPEEDLRRAMDPTTGRADLLDLSTSKSAEVRATVAGRADCPLGVMLTLCQDGDNQVREAIARNRATPSNVLAVLAEGRRGAARDAAERRLRLGDA